MKILGIEGKSLDQLEDEVEDGGKFVIYIWVISLLILTFKRTTDIHYIPPGHSRWTHGIWPTLLSCVVGWWGIPWGLIYTIEAIFTNLGGGRDVTDDVMDSLDRESRRG